MSEQSDISKHEKSLCFFTKIQIGCVLTIIVFITLGNVRIFGIDDDIFLVTAYGLLVALPFIAIVSLIRISLHSERLSGKNGSFLILAIACYFLFEATVYNTPRAEMMGIARRVVCGTNLKGLGIALTVYAYDYDDVLPADNWCDQLIEETDVNPKSLLCPRLDSKEGETDYCLNKSAVGKKLSELPKDMVLLFESDFVPSENQQREPIKNRKKFKNLEIISDIFTGEEKVYLDQWNRVGGSECLAHDRHEGSWNFLFADGHTENIKLDRLSSLRWNIENDVAVDATVVAEQVPLKRQLVISWPVIAAGLFGLLVSIGAGVVLIRFNITCCWKFSLFLGLFSAATGGLFGLMSEDAYSDIVNRYGNPGMIAGVFFGLLAGLCFAVLLANCPDKIKQLKTFKGFSLSVGMVTGIICSTLVHITLMILLKETNPFGIVIGIPYGIFAGAVLGLVSGLIVKKFYREKSLLKAESKE